MTRPSCTARPPHLVSLAMLLAATSCEPGLITPDGTAPDTIFVVRGEASGALAVDGDIRAALAWSVYGADLIDCLDAVPVDGVLDWADDRDYALAQALQSCTFFSERGRSETASVPLEPAFPAQFAIPVNTLPDAGLLSGTDDARLGVAGVLIYSDDDGDARFTETPRGADRFVDRVVGTSLPTDDFAESASYIVYREGGVSPLWKLFEAIYGCPEPAPGFQTMTITIDNDLGEVSCVLDDRLLDVALSEGLETLGCADDPGRAQMLEPTADGVEAGAASICVDGDAGPRELLVTSEPESVCPSFARYALLGCGDASSQAACRRTSWDHTIDPPGWWPCERNGERVRLSVGLNVEATDAVDAELFAIRWFEGAGQAAVDSLTVAVVVGGVEVNLPAAGFRLQDNDNNGVFNLGDILVVGETNNEFSTRTAPGAYPVVVRTNGSDVEVIGAYAPRPAPTVAPITISAVDAPAIITDGIDDVAIITYEGDGVGHPFADLIIVTYVGGELPLRMTGENGGIVAGIDQDGDGLFEPGDTIILRDELTGTYDSFSTELIRSFGGQLYVSLSVKVGEGLQAPLGDTDVIVE